MTGMSDLGMGDGSAAVPGGVTGHATVLVAS